jgi:peptide deformylase
MILPILQDGDKRLLKKSTRVAKIDDSIRELAENLLETMQSNFGVGLAAPQCGVLKQVIIVLIGGTPQVLINPEIVFKSEEKVTDKEGCLSFNGEFYDIPRAKEIVIKYRNLEGRPIKETHTDFTARVIQHEVDHLLGIVFKTYVDT